MQTTTLHFSFIVRITVEPDASCEMSLESWPLRGKVELVSTGQSWRFAQLQQLSSILSDSIVESLNQTGKESCETQSLT